MDLPTQMYKGPSSFVIWDAALLYGLLQFATRPDCAAFGYHHQDHSGQKEWRRNAEDLSKTDSEVRRQLDEQVALYLEAVQLIANRKAGAISVKRTLTPRGIPFMLALRGQRRL